MVVAIVALGGLDAEPSAGQTADDLAGRWLARMEWAGAPGSLVLDVGGAGDSVQAVISLPPLDAEGVAVLSGRLEEGRLVFPGWTLAVEAPPSGDTVLAGVLPGFLEPVHAVPMELRRHGDPADPLPNRPPVAPVGRPVHPLWSVPGEGAVAGGLASDGRRLVVGDDRGVVRALSASDGGELWRRELPAAVRSRPTVDRDRVWIHADDGAVYGLALEDGRVLARRTVWAGRPPDAPDPRAEFRFHASGVTVAEGDLFLGTDAGEVVRLDPATGSVRWRRGTGGPVTGRPAVSDGRVYAGSWDGRLYALDASTGDVLWTADTGAPIPSSPAVADGVVLAGSRSYELVAHRADDGERLWARYVWFSWVEAAPVVHDGRVYAGTSDARSILAVDLRSGTDLWSARLPGSVWGEPLVEGGALWVGTVGVDGYFIPHRGGLTEVDAATGLPRRHLAARPRAEGYWGFATAPVPTRDGIRAVTMDGTVQALPDGAVEEVIAAERAFSRTSVEEGARTAFLRFFADSAVSFGPAPVRGTEAFRSGPEWPPLVWWPAVAEASADGTIGYTTGPYRSDRPDGSAGWGHYHSVWGRDGGGPWRVLLDIGGPHGPVDIPSRVARPGPAARPGAVGAGVENDDAPLGGLMAMERDYLRRHLAGGGEAAARAFFSPRARIYRQGRAPFPDLEAALASDGWAGERQSWEVAGGGVAGSGDLGYTWGTGHVVDGPASWARVWRREDGGSWRIVLEVFLPQPPGPDG